MSGSAATVAVTSTRALVEAAERRGVDVDALLDAHQLQRAWLHQRERRIPAGTAMAVWADAMRLAEEPELPTWAAVELGWGAYRVIDMLATSAATVGEAFELVSRYFGLVHDTIALPLTERRGGASMAIVNPAGRRIPPVYVDYTLAACVFRTSLAADQPLHPVVRLCRPAPGDLAAHQRAFGPHLQFGEPRDRVDFDAELWSTPMPARDPVLQGLLRQHADQALASRSSGPPAALVDVAAILSELLPRGRAQIDVVARRLGISKRTLQRRITAAGTTWTELLTATRLRLAENLLRDPDLTVDDVSVLVGYAEASAFHRAFRRWTGLSPGAWREQV
ncbi:MAG: AraC family transcriptional regulator [Myxococcales bacterium]|nr:AraC family transcriptional regulator [Myxococcales bacterium]